MQCPACKRDVPVSFKCRACGAPLMRTTPPPSSGAARPRPAPAASATGGVPAAPARPAPPPRPPVSAAPAGAPAPLPRVRPPAAPPVAPAVNPYAAPVRPPMPVPRGPVSPARPAGLFSEPIEQTLAGRGQRLVAQLLDGFFGIGCMLPGVLLVSVATEGRGEPGPASLAVSVVGLLLALGGLLFVLVYQLRLLSREGQTWGKKQMKIRIVLYTTGEIPGLGRTFGLRMVVNSLIGAIPCAGAIYSLVDLLFIFGPERRCVHDLLAGTKVVEAE